MCRGLLGIGCFGRISLVQLTVCAVSDLGGMRMRGGGGGETYKIYR